MIHFSFCLSNSDAVDAADDAERLKQPQGDHNNHNDVEDFFDRAWPWGCKY